MKREVRVFRLIVQGVSRDVRSRGDGIGVMGLCEDETGRLMVIEDIVGTTTDVELNIWKRSTWAQERGERRRPGVCIVVQDNYHTQ